MTFPLLSSVSGSLTSRCRPHCAFSPCIFFHYFSRLLLLCAFYFPKCISFLLYCITLYFFYFLLLCRYIYDKDVVIITHFGVPTLFFSPQWQGRWVPEQNSVEFQSKRIFQR